MSEHAAFMPRISFSAFRIIKRGWGFILLLCEAEEGGGPYPTPSLGPPFCGAPLLLAQPLQ
jgi:hypothetical protein